MYHTSTTTAGHNRIPARFDVRHHSPEREKEIADDYARWIQNVPTFDWRPLSKRYRTHAPHVLLWLTVRALPAPWVQRPYLASAGYLPSIPSGVFAHDVSDDGSSVLTGPVEYPAGSDVTSWCDLTGMYTGETNDERTRWTFMPSKWDETSAPTDQIERFGYVLWRDYLMFSALQWHSKDNRWLYLDGCAVEDDSSQVLAWIDADDLVPYLANERVCLLNLLDVQKVFQLVCGILLENWKAQQAASFLNERLLAIHRKSSEWDPISKLNASSEIAYDTVRKLPSPWVLRELAHDTEPLDDIPSGVTAYAYFYGKDETQVLHGPLFGADLTNVRQWCNSDLLTPDGRPIWHTRGVAPLPLSGDRLPHKDPFVLAVLIVLDRRTNEFIARVREVRCDLDTGRWFLFDKPKVEVTELVEAWVYHFKMNFETGMPFKGTIRYLLDEKDIAALQRALPHIHCPESLRRDFVAAIGQQCALQLTDETWREPLRVEKRHPDGALP